MTYLRLPRITGKNEKEQLEELKNYLYQLVEQIQYAFNEIENKLKQTQTGTENKQEEI